MNLDLAVIGRGAVSPSGIGVAALRENPPEPTMTAEIRRPGRTWPVLRVEPSSPELARWQREPRLRRCSPVTLFLVEAAEQALAGASPADRAETGLIVAFSAGCVAHSRRFFQDMIREGRNFASPALFPETVFNSPGSHVAAALKLNGAACALVGDESAWIGALKTAAIWLRQQRVTQVVILGAEEFDPIALDAYACARWLRSSTGAFLPSEGAGGILVRLAKAGDTCVISAVRDGFIYRTKAQATAAAENLFRVIDPKLPCVSTARGTWLEALENKILRARVTLPNDDSPHLGQAFTASTAWNIIRALDRLNGKMPVLALPIWGLNHELGMIALACGPSAEAL